MNRTMSRQPLMPHSARSRSDPIIAYSTSSGLHIYQTASAVHVPFLSSDEIAIVHTYIHTAHGALYCNNMHSNASVEVLYTKVHITHNYAVQSYCTYMYIHVLYTQSLICIKYTCTYVHM